MVDTVEEILNTTVDVFDVANGAAVSVAVTDASTRYVIKDIQIEGAPPPLSLEINGFPAVKSFSDSVSGSEIIGPNSTAELVANPLVSVVDRTFGWHYSNQDQLVRRTIPLAGASTAPVTDNNDYSTLWTGSGSYKRVFFDGTYITGVDWDGNSQARVYKYQFGSALIQTGTYSSYSTPGTFSDDGYVYFCQQGNIRRMSLTTNAADEIVSTSMTGYPNTTYPGFGTNEQLSPDGLRCFVWNNYYLGTLRVRWVNQADMTLVAEYDLGPTTNNASTSWGSCVYNPFYDAVEKRWKLLTKGGGNQHYIGVLSLPNSDVAPTPLVTVTSGTAFTSLYCLPNVRDNRIYFADDSTGDVRSYDLNMGDLRDEFAGIGINGNGVLSMSLIDAIPSAGTIAAREYTPVIAPGKVRITGIKSV